MNFDRHDPNVLIAVIGADGHFAGGMKRLDDSSFYSWLDVPGRGRKSKASTAVGDAEAALDVMLDHADLDVECYYAPEMNAPRTFIQDGLAKLGDPDVARKQAELVRIRAASPMRPIDGRTADIDGLALFDVVRSPSLF